MIYIQAPDDLQENNNEFNDHIKALWSELFFIDSWSSKWSSYLDCTYIYHLKSYKPSVA